MNFFRKTASKLVSLTDEQWQLTSLQLAWSESMYFLFESRCEYVHADAEINVPHPPPPQFPVLNYEYALPIPVSV